MKRYRATIPFMALSWMDQAPQYADVVPDGPGITYFKGVINETAWVDCLLSYDANLELVGILNHFPMDTPWDAAGDITMFVRPDRYRRGIASALLDEARRRWTIDLDQQNFTHAGAAFINRYVQRHGLSDGTSRITGR
jgi:GNAT superfamily N-acetyltransferase